MTCRNPLNCKVYIFKRFSCIALYLVINTFDNRELIKSRWNKKMIKKNLQKRMILMAQPLQDTSSRLKLKEEGNPEDSRIILARLSE